MKTSFPSALAFAAVTIASALPSIANDLRRRDTAQNVTLIFEGGPASYNLSIAADGQEYLTENDQLSVSLIISPDYDLYQYCTFTTTSASFALAPSLVQRSQDAFPINEVAVGPPQPIISVTCSGVCLPVYGECETYDPTNGISVLDCCNGFCAATRCRPWSIN